jgi:hypothetical protein
MLALLAPPARGFRAPERRGFRPRRPSSYGDADACLTSRRHSTESRPSVDGETHITSDMTRELRPPGFATPSRDGSAARTGAESETIKGGRRLEGSTVDDLGRGLDVPPVFRPRTARGGWICRRRCSGR